MAEELEALVGYVLAAGGRFVNAAPPGAIVELPPRKTQRGREGDTFFALISPGGRGQANADLYGQLVHYAADQYFRTGGSVTSALREVLGAVNGQLRDHTANTGARIEVSMAALVLRGHEVYLARAGGSACLLKCGAEFRTLPAALTDALDPELLHLGGADSPDIRLTRYEVAPGDLLTLADAGICRVEPIHLENALNQGGLPKVIEGIKGLSTPSLQAVVIEFVAADAPDPTAAVTVEATSTGKAQKRPAGTIRIPLKEQAPKVSAPALIDESVPADTEMGESGDTATGKPNVLARLGSAVGGVGRGIGRAIDRLLPEPADEYSPRVPTMLAAALAVLVPVMLVFIIVGLRLSQFDVTNFEQEVQEVVAAADQARGIPLEDATSARAAWQAVIQRVELVESGAGRTNDPVLMGIRAEAQGIIDRFDKVTRRPVTLLRNFGEEARLADPVIRGGSDVYNLDLSHSAVYRDTLSPNSVVLLTRNAQPVIQRGQAVSAFSVRQLIDMVWMPEGGVQRANVLAALDTQGLLVTYSPTFAPATAQRLPGVDLWGEPRAIYTWRGNLYILDPKADQIWRYRPVGSAYPNPPESYFEEDPRPDLELAIDLAIDSTGNIYILFADGEIGKFNGGQEQRFVYTEMPDGGAPRSGSAMFLDSESPLPAIYLLDPADKSVYQVTLSGAFKYRFRAQDDNNFRALNGLFVGGDTLYVASAGALFSFSIADLAGGQ